MKLRALALATSIASVTMPASAQQQSIYIQRGVAPMEASRALFGAPSGRLAAGDYAYKAEARKLPAAFRFVWDSAGPSPFVGTRADSAFLDMQFYATSGTQKQWFYEWFGHQDTERIAHSYFPKARGYFLTYKEGAGQSPVSSTPYGGNVSGDVVFVNPNAEVWGISPAPLEVLENGELVFAEGDASVFGPAHPLGRRAVTSLRGMLGASFGGAILGGGAAYLTSEILGRYGDPASTMVGLYTSSYVVSATTTASFGSTFAGNAFVAVPILAGYSIYRSHNDHLQRRAQTSAAHRYVLETGAFPPWLKVFRDPGGGGQAFAGGSTISCHAPALQNDATLLFEELTALQAVHRADAAMRQRRACQRSSSHARVLKPGDPEYDAILRYASGR